MCMHMHLHCTIPKRRRSEASKILRHCVNTCSSHCVRTPRTSWPIQSPAWPEVHTTTATTSCLHRPHSDPSYHTSTTSRPMPARSHSGSSPVRVCQSLSSLSAELRVGGRVLRVSEKSSTSDLSPASTYLRRHHPICTAVDVSLPSGSICRPLTKTTRTPLATVPYASARLLTDLVLTILAVVDLV